MHTIDDLDLSILGALETNGRIPVADLARRLDEPASTVRDRMQKLEEEGVIQGYRAVIDATKLGLSIKAVLRIGRDTDVSISEMVSEAANLTEVVSLQVLTGEVDQLVTFYAHDVDDLRHILYDKFSSLRGIDDLNTNIVLEEREFALIRRFLGEELAPRNE